MEFLKHYELPHDYPLDGSTFINKTSILIADMTDKAIVQCIIDFAIVKGITDLYLIDEEFIKTALMNEVERRKGIKYETV